MASAYSFTSLVCAVFLFFANDVVAFSPDCQFKVGEGPDSLTPAGGYLDAPLFNDRSIAIAPNGDIYVLDPLAQRLLVGKNSSGGCEVHAVPFAAHDVRSIAFLGTQLFGITGDGEVIIVGGAPPQSGSSRNSPPWEGSGARPHSVPAAVRAQLLMHMPLLSDHRAIWPSAKNAGSSPGELGSTENENRRVTTERFPQVESSGGAYLFGVTMQSLNTASVKLYKAEDLQSPVWTGEVWVPHALGSVEVFAVAKDGTVYSASEDFWLSSALRVTVSLVLDRWSWSGKHLATETLDFSDVQASGNEPVAGSPKLKDETHVSVPVLSQKSLTHISVELRPPGVAEQRKSGEPWKINSTLSKRQMDILGRADAFLTRAWTVQRSNLNDGAADLCQPPAAMWIRPASLREVHVNDTVYGVPYKWNGKRSVAAIVDQLHNGAIAGNICCRVFKEPSSGHLVPVDIPGSTGIDCSGFVARAWDLKDSKGHELDLGTEGLLSRFARRTDLKQLAAGDALDFPRSHVRLFVAWKETTQGRMIRAYESTAAALCSGACVRDLPVRMYMGYIPLASP